MAKRPIKLAMTMCTAINYKHGCHIVLNTRRFFREGESRMINLYNLYDSYFTASGEYISQKLYTSSSSIYICFFLQELMCALDGKEFVPPDNKGYKRSRREKNGGGSVEYMVERYGHVE